tara:strand:+ start:317 stop:478 length:162 start_codon:yes stop_codon:yes gene_type:complete
MKSILIILFISIALVGFLVYSLYQAPLYDDDFNEILEHDLDEDFEETEDAENI